MANVVDSGAWISPTDVMASNGVIHVDDGSLPSAPTLS